MAKVTICNLSSKPENVCEKGINNYRETMGANQAEGTEQARERKRMKIPILPLTHPPLCRKTHW